MTGRRPTPKNESVPAGTEPEEKSSRIQKSGCFFVRHRTGRGGSRHGCVCFSRYSGGTRFVSQIPFLDR